MQTPLERKVLLGFSAAVALLLFSGGAAWFSATRTTERTAWVDHSHRVLYQAEAVLADLLNMQSTTRGYRLSFSRMGRAALQPTRLDHSVLVAAIMRVGRYEQWHPTVVWRVNPLHAAPALSVRDEASPAC